MQTRFTAEQRADPAVASSEAIIRTCVHCGFCNATCPTHVLLGDELDSPRGRIYLIKEMLEKGGAPAASTVTHVDRCLSCLACMTTCPSGVNYMHLIDQARAHIETHHRRPLSDRLLRDLLAAVLTRTGLFRAALAAARWTRPLHRLLPGRLRGIAAMAPRARPIATPSPPSMTIAPGARRARVALLTGCVQPVLAPQIDQAAIRLLTRLGVEVVTVSGGGCCGALAHHLGKAERSLALARANIAALLAVEESGDLDGVLITASGCGVTVKDYGFMMRGDPVWAARAARVSALAKDASELLSGLGMPASSLQPPGLRVAYHAACSLQHGQAVVEAPKDLLRAAGFEVVEPAEAHICCGSAGVYNLLQPDIAGRLRERKALSLMAMAPDVIVTGNIGCMTQLAPAVGAPVVHLVELLDWAAGGPMPDVLSSLKGAASTR